MILIDSSISTWRTWLQDANQIAQLIGTILVVIYVIYTYLTFRQIKKQTDYQQDAYLKSELSILKEIIESGPMQFQNSKFTNSKNTFSLKYLDLSLATKMKGILKPIFNFEDSLFDGNYLIVSFTNYGNAEVNKIIVKVTVTVLNSKELIDKKMLREREIEVIDVVINEIVQRNGGNLKVPILTTASFPIYSISVKGEYFDVRNKKYIIAEERLQGQNKHLQILQ
ncbi:hypothetical protein [Pedobacter arcticus]|uniref:hypothetical protein n=1 Tax=Pedobacter arcticus TaxID=752140 RepID=UPI0002F62861|nr:hypothetical protein [Pedobacter arcticus]